MQDIQHTSGTSTSLAVRDITTENTPTPTKLTADMAAEDMETEVTAA